MELVGLDTEQVNRCIATYEDSDGLSTISAVHRALEVWGIEPLKEDAELVQNGLAAVGYPGDGAMLLHQFIALVGYLHKKVHERPPPDTSIVVHPHRIKSPPSGSTEPFGSVIFDPEKSEQHALKKMLEEADKLLPVDTTASPVEEVEDSKATSYLLSRICEAPVESLKEIVHLYNLDVEVHEPEGSFLIAPRTIDDVLCDYITTTPGAYDDPPSLTSSACGTPSSVRHSTLSLPSPSTLARVGYLFKAGRRPSSKSFKGISRILKRKDAAGGDLSKMVAMRLDHIVAGSEAQRRSFRTRRLRTKRQTWYESAEGTLLRACDRKHERVAPVDPRSPMAAVRRAQRAPHPCVARRGRSLDVPTKLAHMAFSYFPDDACLLARQLREAFVQQESGRGGPTPLAWPPPNTTQPDESAGNPTSKPHPGPPALTPRRTSSRRCTGDSSHQGSTPKPKQGRKVRRPPEKPRHEVVEVASVEGLDDQMNFWVQSKPRTAVPPSPSPRVAAAGPAVNLLRSTPRTAGIAPKTRTGKKKKKKTPKGGDEVHSPLPSPASLPSAISVSSTDASSILEPTWA